MILRAGCGRPHAGLFEKSVILTIVFTCAVLDDVGDCIFVTRDESAAFLNASV